MKAIEPTAPAANATRPAPRRMRKPIVLPDEVQPIGNVVRENVGIQHHNAADDGRKRDGVPEGEAEDGSFVPYLIGGGRGNANGLRVNHLAHHAPGAVRGAHENRTEVELLRGDSLQISEKRV